MNRHWKGMLAIVIATCAAVALALVAGAPVIAFAALVSGFVVAYVLGIAWMRPNFRSRGTGPSSRSTVDSVSK